ncbi:hypothetical protein DPMN_067585 [Dreissena polymorpha]|uniref:Uncharacterized protein n=1 Tax=Dreissena polymorpha TaxID=45954 RepID=A0A9D3YZH2_DREPO|nr:hypothetical protein DPMN_067585 [Dreissena polymorpha]
MLREYYRYTKLMYISSVLISPHAKVCCLSQTHVYHRLNTILYTKWLQIYKHNTTVPRMPAPCCLLRAEVLPAIGSDCSVQRNVIYITLLHMLDEIEASRITLTNTNF